MASLTVPLVRVEQGVLQKLLRNAFLQELWDPGPPVAKTSIWHLKSRGAISLDKEIFGLDRGDAGLQEIFGNGKDITLERTCRRILKGCKSSFAFAFEHKHASDASLQKIEPLINELEWQQEEPTKKEAETKS
jgi:hypothetical protein